MKKQKTKATGLESYEGEAELAAGEQVAGSGGEYPWRCGERRTREKSLRAPGAGVLFIHPLSLNPKHTIEYAKDHEMKRDHQSNKGPPTSWPKAAAAGTLMPRRPKTYKMAVKGVLTRPCEDWLRAYSTKF
jgi:hypothetical protein